ncbi:hypothetical protein MJD09_13365 [bacterium]|nr:hypothetical protein [bacterium]
MLIHPFVIDPQNEDVMYFPLQREIREVTKLLSGQVMSAGRYEIPVTLSSFASGMYLYNLQVTSENTKQSSISQTRKLVLLK